MKTRNWTRAIIFSIGASAGLDACRNAPADKPREVVFVCEHGAAKSVIAAAYFNQLATERGLAVRAIARGADPQANPSTKTMEGLKADGMTAIPEAPQPLKAGDVRSASEIVTFDCEEPTMKALSAMGTCWNDVPALADGYAGTRDGIRTHVARLVGDIAR
jgi:arsenate reductase